MILKYLCIFLWTWPGIMAFKLLGETRVAPVDPCAPFLEKVDDYLGTNSIRDDFSGGKPTVTKVLTKIIPEIVFGMEQINTTDVREAAKKMFCKDIELHYFFDDKMRSINRKISNIWKAKNAGEILGSITGIGVELTESMEMLAKMVDETEKYYIKEIKSLYETAALIGPQVKETIIAVHKIENEAREIRFSLKILAETTIRRCNTILRAIENLLSSETPREKDFTKMLRYTAKLLDISHRTLGESILSYQRIKDELRRLVTDFAVYENELGNIQEKSEKVYKQKKIEAGLKIAFGVISSIASAATSGYNLADGVFKFGDIAGPAGVAGGLAFYTSEIMGLDTLLVDYSRMSAKLRAIINDVKKYVKSSTKLQTVLTLEETAAKEWHHIVKEIQADLGKDLKMLTEAFKDEEEEELQEAKEIFDLLRKKAQDFLNILEETKPAVDNIRKLLSSL